MGEAKYILRGPDSEPVESTPNGLEGLQIGLQDRNLHSWGEASFAFRGRRRVGCAVA